MDKNELGYMHSFFDTLSVSVLLGYFLGALPTVALILTTVWTALRIWEMQTVLGWRLAIKAWFRKGV